MVGTVNYEALAYGANGYLYGFRQQGEVDQIDPTQGTVTVYTSVPTIGSSGTDYIWSGDAVGDTAGAGAYVAATQYDNRGHYYLALFYLAFGASPGWQQLVFGQVRGC